MNKLKYALSILLAALVIAGGALAPRIAAQVQDRLDSGNIHCDPLQSIQLNIQEEQEALPMLAKLALLRGGYSMDIGNIKTNLTEHSAVNTARDQLVKYQYMALLPSDFLNYNLSAVPGIVCSGSGPWGEEYYNVFWYVSLEPVDYAHLSIILDDQTGLIVSIEYTCEIPYITTEDAYYYMEPFYQSFCDTIQEKPDAINWLDMDAAVGVDCTWEDEVFGDVIMEFLIYGDGFSAIVVQPFSSSPGKT